MPQAISIVVSDPGVGHFSGHGMADFIPAWNSSDDAAHHDLLRGRCFGQLLSESLLRTLLYSTAKRGQIIESMFVKLRRGESIQTFNIWVYGEGSLARGSGLYGVRTDLDSASIQEVHRVGTSIVTF